MLSAILSVLTAANYLDSSNQEGTMTTCELPGKGRPPQTCA